MEVALKRQDHPTYLKLQEFTKKLTETTDELKSLSIQIELKQQDVLRRFHQIQQQVQAKQVLLEQSRVVVDTTNQYDVMATSTFELLNQTDFFLHNLDHNLIHIFANDPTINFNELQLSINTTKHEFTNIYHGLLDGTYTTRDLYR